MYVSHLIRLGLNAAIMAYGQTSTGKTHTMVGESCFAKVVHLGRLGEEGCSCVSMSLRTAFAEPSCPGATRALLSA